MKSVQAPRSTQASSRKVISGYKAFSMGPKSTCSKLLIFASIKKSVPGEIEVRAFGDRRRPCILNEITAYPHLMLAFNPDSFIRFGHDFVSISSIYGGIHCAMSKLSFL
jgi:hypothetical protein